MKEKGSVQTAFENEVANTTMAGVEVVGKVAQGLKEKFSGTGQVAKEMLTYRLSKMFLGSRRRMR